MEYNAHYGLKPGIMRDPVPVDAYKTRKKPYTILIIDSDESSADRIKKIFSRRKKTFQLTFTRTLEEAREVLGTVEPALIFAALELPDGRGIEVLPKTDGYATLPLVILADRGNQKDAQAVLKSGAVDYVVKSDVSLEGLPFIAERSMAGWGNLMKRVAAEKAAGESREKFQALIENITAGIGYYDFEGNTLFYNKAAAGAMGGRPEDFVGKSIYDLFDRALADTIFRRIQATRKSPEKPGVYEDPVTLPTGTKWFLSLYSPVRNKGGAITGVQIISTDITGLKQAEEEAAQFRKRLADILDFLPDATFAIDAEGRVIAWNRAIEAMTGVPSDQIIGRGDYEYSIPFYGERRPILIDLVLKSRDNIEQKYLYIQRDGDKITSETFIPDIFEGRGAHLWGTASPLYDLHGNLAGAVEVIRDITERKESERALIKSEKLLNQTQQYAHVGGWEYDILSGTITWTDEVYRIYEVPVDFDPNNIQEDLAFYSPEDRSILEDAFRRAVEEGIPYDLEMRFVSGTGVKKWVKTIAQVECDDGRPIRLIGTIVDITDKKEAEIRVSELLESARNEKERLSTLLNSITDEVWFTDTDHRFTLANPQALEEFQLREGDTPIVEDLARSLEVLRPDGTPRPVEEAPPLRALSGEVIRNMEEIIRTPVTGEFRYRQISSTPVRDTTGAIIGSVSVVRDITNQKRAEEEIRESNERFKIVSKATNDTVWDWDLLTDSQWWNEGIQSVFGYRPEEIEPTVASWYTRIHPDDRERIIDGIHAAKDGGENKWSDEYRFRKADGTYAYVFDRGFVIRDPEGRAIRMVGAIQDLTERMRMVDALRESEERFRHILEDQTEFICRFRPDGTYVFVNDAYARYFAKTREELIGHIYRPVVFPEDRQIVQDVFDSLSQEHPVATSEHRITMPDGRVRWQQWSDRAIFDETGAVREYQSVGRDITAQKEAEEALKQSEARFRNLFSNMSAGVAIYGVVEDGKDFIFREINPAVERIENVRRVDVIGKSVLEVFPGVKEFGLFEVFQRVWRTGIPEQHPVSEYRDGRISGWRENTIYRLPSGEVVSIYEDVTGKKQAEEAIRLSEARYRTLTEGIPDIIARFDREHRHTYINQAIERVTGKPAESFLGRTNQDLGMPDELNRLWDENLDRVFEEGSPVTFEFVYPSGENPVVFESRIIPEFSQSGEVLSVISVARDISAEKRADKKRKESESRLDVAMEMGNIAWWEMDLPSGGVRFHDRKATMLGYAPGQFATYQDFCALIYPDDLDRTMQAMRDHLEGKVPRYDVEYRIRTSGGEWRWFHDSGGVTRRDPDGKPATVTGMVVDITGIKMAEEALREAEERYEEIVTHALDSIFIIDVTADERFRIRYMNPVSEDEMGITNASASGRFIEDLFPGETSEHLSSMYRQCVKTGSPLSYEETMDRGPGRRYYSTTLIPLKGAGKRTERIIGISHDITNRKLMESEIRALNTVLEQRVIERTRELERTNLALIAEIGQREVAEEKLRETNEYLNNLFDYANAPIIVWDPEFRITRFNHAFEWLTGCPSAEVIGQPVSVLFPEQSRERSMAYLRQAMEGERWEAVEIPIHGREGIERIVLWNSATLLAGDGKTVVAAIAQGQDITERKNAEEKLRTSLDEKLTLLKEVHHRVKNNLQIIVSLLNLQSRYITDEKTLAAIRESQNRVRAMALVHEKLYQTENLSQINLDDYLKYLGKSLFQFYGAGTRGITFSTDAAGIHVDINTAIPFGLIMNELISNSLKYGFPERRRGEVSISVRREDRALYVEYRDTGVGIPDGLDWQDTKSLGLRLVNSLVSQLNGSIALDRREGTAFSMVLYEKE